jgi:hypothetical protein
MDEKHLFIGHLAQNEGWESREIAVFLDLSPSTVERVLSAIHLTGVKVREAEVNLCELLPVLFNAV